MRTPRYTYYTFINYSILATRVSYGVTELVDGLVLHIFKYEFYGNIFLCCSFCWTELQMQH